MIFRDRTVAGRKLAQQLNDYRHRQDVLVLGIPRGGVPVAFEIAKAIAAPLDVFLSRKLGVPGQEELAFGAIAAGDGVFLDQQVIREAGVTRNQFESVSQRVRTLLNQRAILYRGTLEPLHVKGKTVILVDDGIATGSSIYAAINALRHTEPARLVVAVPVAPSSTCAWLRRSLDELICLFIPEHFHAVGRFYEVFSQISDEEVIHLLQQARSWMPPQSDPSHVPGKLSS